MEYIILHDRKGITLGRSERLATGIGKLTLAGYSVNVKPNVGPDGLDRGWNPKFRAEWIEHGDGTVVGYDNNRNIILHAEKGGD